MGRHKQDHTNKRYGLLVGVRFVELDKWGGTIWEFVCDCGNTTRVRTSCVKRGNTQSCGCLHKEAVKKSCTTHGYTGTKEHRTWNHIKSRCSNESNSNWSYYGGRGLTFDYNNDFLGFLQEVGPAPENSAAWSIDRINPNLGYVKGNMRWVRREQQSRNRRKLSNNTSGVTGVVWRYKNQKEEWAVATWRENGKPMFKYFSVKKLGKQEAFEAACKYREEMIKLLNEEGYGYTEFHGE